MNPAMAGLRRILWRRAGAANVLIVTRSSIPNKFPPSWVRIDILLSRALDSARSEIIGTSLEHREATHACRYEDLDEGTRCGTRGLLRLSSARRFRSAGATSAAL